MELLWKYLTAKTIFAKSYIIDVWQGPKYASVRWSEKVRLFNLFKGLSPVPNYRNSLKFKHELTTSSAWKIENTVKPALTVFLFKNSRNFEKINTLDINQNSLSAKVNTYEKSQTFQSNNEVSL